MNYKDLADLIFPNAKEISYYEEKYPNRNLKEGAVVTRYAPSPTGVMHIGGLYQALIAKKLSKQTDGVFFLRIEDTDQKREIENGVSEIVSSLKDFGMEADEGMLTDTEEKGNYGPYKQSLRKEIYQAYAKYLIEQGKAYPCFCTPEDVEQIRQKQESAKIRPGYYGVWAKCRNITVEEAIEKIKNGDKYIIRFKSLGREDRKIKHHDIIKGNVDFPENDQDVVIIKADGLPTYHFAHAIDDHLMHTTHVIRGDEWLSSVPLHLQLFHELGFKAPKYAHIAPIMKNDDGNKRKLSKRKDPEAAVSYYAKEGIPAEAVKEYLLNIANSSFENWRRQNKDKSIDEFELQLNKMNRGNNYSPTGYLNKKGVHPGSAARKSDNVPSLRYPLPIIRLGELYLDYAEACVGYGDASYVAEGMKKLNVIRERAGIDPVLTAWAKAKEPLTDYSSVGPDGRLMQIVRQERMIELYMETHNFWDLRRWKLGEKYFGVYPRGLNVEAYLSY